MSDFKPDWVSAPGDTIFDVLEERGWTIADLSECLDLSASSMNGLFNGTLRITEDLAMKLASTLGSTAEFWLNREAQYRVSMESLASAGGTHA